MSDWYNSSTFQSSEKVILAEDIPIIYSGDYPGKFYFPIATPDTTIPATKPVDKKMPAPRVTTPAGGQKLATKKYELSNYITLVIPGYIVSQFEDVIPAGTEFVLSSLGGDYHIDKMKIIGLG